VKQNGVGGGGSRNAKSGSKRWVRVDRGAANQGGAPRSSRKIAAIYGFVVAREALERHSNCSRPYRETRSSAARGDHFEQIVVTSSGFFDLQHGKTRGGSRAPPRMALGFRVLRGTPGREFVHSRWRLSTRVVVYTCCYRYIYTCCCLHVLLSIYLHVLLSTRVDCG
jgi:hypothetical protein